MNAFYEATDLAVKANRKGTALEVHRADCPRVTGAGRGTVHPLPDYPATVAAEMTPANCCRVRAVRDAIQAAADVVAAEAAHRPLEWLRGPAGDHTGHIWETWHAYVNDPENFPKWVTDDDSGVICHTCHTVYVDVVDPAPEAGPEVTEAAAALGEALAGARGVTRLPVRHADPCQWVGCDRAATGSRVLAGQTWRVCKGHQGVDL